MKNSIKAKLKLALLPIGLGLIAYTIYIIVGNFSSLKSLSLLNPYLILLSVLLITINVYATGRLFDVALNNANNQKILPAESFGLAALARFGNYISFGQVGFVIRVLYLKKFHSVKTSDSIINLGVGNLVFYFISIVTAIVIFYLKGNDSIISPQYTNLFLAVFLAILLLIFLFAKTSFLSAIHKKYLKDYSSSLKSLFLSKKTFLDFSIWSTIMLLTFSAMLIVEFGILGEKLSIIDALFLTGLANMAAIINITPAGIGVSEGLLLLGGSIIGISPELLIASALIRRAVVFSFVSLVSYYFSRKIFGKSLLDLVRSSKRRTYETET